MLIVYNLRGVYSHLLLEHGFTHARH